MLLVHYPRSLALPHRYRRAGGFSLGMGQRLGVAAALLGRPQTVVLDEPVNGLDPDGVRWIRLLLKSLAAEGRTVFVSSHLMSEMAQTATRLVVLGRGRLITEASVEDFVDHATTAGVLVRTPETVRLGQLLAAPGVTVINDGTGLLRVSGITAEQIGTAAWRAHLGSGPARCSASWSLLRRCWRNGRSGARCSRSRWRSACTPSRPR